MLGWWADRSTEVAFVDDVNSIAMSTHEPRPELLLAETVGSVAYVASGVSMSAIQNRPGLHRDVIPYQGGFGGAVTFALTPNFFRAYAVNGNSVVPINLLTRDILSADIIQLAGHPQGIVATQDGTSVFVASLANDISEINTTTNR